MLHRTLFVLALLAVVAPLVPQQPDPLEAGFAVPPPEARLRCYWWWLNGNTNEAAITRDLEQMRAKGYGGAILVDADGSGQEHNRMVPAGPTFGSDALARAVSPRAQGSGAARPRNQPQRRKRMESRRT